jgi:hypothetical protein
MTSSYQDQIEQYYQIEEDAVGAGVETVEAELVDFSTGISLIDPSSEEVLTGETLDTVVLSSRGNTRPVVVTNQNPVDIDITNKESSEVEVSLLGIQRAETALNLFDAVNIYGVNKKEWTAQVGSYTYLSDPPSWTFRDSYGNYARHLPAESAIQAYAYPPPVSFSYPSDDGTGRFPGGYTDGVMTVFWESKRAFRYQPGRVTGFTLGVRMSTGSNHNGEIVQWGCRNDYGDGYYFQLEKGTDLSIIYKRFNPSSSAIEEIKVPRADWNGDQVSTGQTSTGWVLDLSKVTMFKIEFSWYGAVGAKFLAYVPVGNGEARWVTLHYLLIENQLDFPSLRSAFMKMFVQARSTAGTSLPAFINLYGSSVYIDGGDKGTVTLGSAALSTAKNIDSTPREILGLQVKGKINGIDNQKAVYPVSLAAFASVPSRIDLVFQEGGIGAGESYSYGNGTNLVRGASSPIAVTSAGNVLTGTFPTLSAELSGSTDYTTGRRVRVTGSGIFNTHVIAATPSQITTDRPVPAGTTSIRLSRFNAHAVASGAIPSGVLNGTIFFDTGGGQWRLGAWPRASGQPYSTSESVLWFARKYTGLAFAANGSVTGEREFPLAPYRQASFAITFPNGGTDTLISFDDGLAVRSVTISGTANPWPIALVAELMDDSQLNDVVVVRGTETERITPGSGATIAISQWSAVSGVTQDSSVAGASYVANKFESSASDPLSAVLVDTQGYRTLKAPERVATYFLGAGETKQFDLSNIFGPDKMFITGPPGTIYNSGALFVVASSRAASGVASATLNWEEQ